MSNETLDEVVVGYENQKENCGMSFVEYFQSQLTRKKTQELESIREDYRALLKIEEDKTRILDRDRDTLTEGLKKLKHTIITDKKQNENNVEGLIKKISILSQELENVRLNVNDIKRQKQEIEKINKEVKAKLEQAHKEYENENKKLQVCVIRNDDKNEYWKQMKEKQEELQAEYEEREKMLREKLVETNSQVEDARDIEKKFMETKCKVKRLLNELETLKELNHLGDKERQMLIKTTKEREKLTAALSQLIISKLDPHMDEQTLNQLDAIMQKLDKIIERAKNTTQFMNYTRALQRKQLK